jgi:ParB-like chromosome segregation protein Spo0J
LLPVVVIDKPINDRMASTIRHNRARGKHMVKGMSQMVFQLLEQGWDDSDICNELGMAPEELIRLKHITGFSKLYANAEYRQAWMTERQVRIAHAYQQTLANGGENGASDDISQAPASLQSATPHE